MGLNGQRSTPRPICVIGGSGQIGERLVQVLSERGWPVTSTYYHHARPGASALDATDAVQVHELVSRLRPRLIINSLNAPGGTDACEADPELARRVHFETARHLMDAARAVKAKFVQISTDYVFDGREGPYGEDAIPAPLSQLGRAKLHAEEYALQYLSESLVVRTSFVFSWTPHSATKNFVMQMLEHDQRKQVLRVPNDQVGNMTYAPNFAEALVELIELGAHGLYHVAGRTRCSKHAWALRVAAYFGLSPEIIEGVSTTALGQRGPRPLQSGFRLEKVQAVLKRTRLMSLDEGLADMAREMGVVGQSVGR